MPKNNATAKTGAEDKALKAVLSEIKHVKKELSKLATAQKKTSRELHSVKKKLAKAKYCKCAPKKKKKKPTAKSTVTSEMRPEIAALSNGVTPQPLQGVLTKPMNGVADDLKWISGVGPKLEETLNGLGVFHFEQIAAWTKAEIDWVDDYLKFSGRIERDNWIEQAKALAKGGWDEYVKVFGKEPR